MLMPLATDDLEAQARYTAFLEGLQQLDWTDGRNVHVDTRWSAGNASDTRKYAEELVALAPDVIFAMAARALGRRCRQPGLFRSYSQSFPIRSAAATSKACRNRGATLRAS